MALLLSEKLNREKASSIRDKLREREGGKEMGAAVPQPLRISKFPTPLVDATPIHVITTAASLQVCHLLRRGIPLSTKRFSCLGHVPRLKAEWFGRAFKVKEIDLIQFSNCTFASTCSACLCFFNGGETQKESQNEGTSCSETSGSSLGHRRRWTNVLLATNVLIYIAQIATQGKLLFWGAKINSLIDNGQLWRLATSSFLHANIGHLMVNCYSLNSVGPAMENLSGPERYLAVYVTSAIASSAASYWFSDAPAVGASGAIFGLVGSLAVYVMRHKGLVNGGKDLQHIAHILVLNMVIGLLTTGIDNWGHLGGLFGGAATSWLLGPAWKCESLSSDGRRTLVDKAPIFYLIKRRKDIVV